MTKKKIRFTWWDAEGFCVSKSYKDAIMSTSLKSNVNKFQRFENNKQVRKYISNVKTSIKISAAYLEWGPVLHPLLMQLGHFQSIHLSFFVKGKSGVKEEGKKPHKPASNHINLNADNQNVI